MDSAHFRRLMDLVGDALELPGAEREAWLAARTGDDRALIDEVRALLAGASTDELEALTEGLEDRVIRAARWVAGGRRAPPERVGPYAIRTVLGEGGMGVVYGARQDEPLRRDVALKVLHPGTHAPLVLARFESERRTLASLDHPCIAHVYDAGTTEEGLPWFAMEWVRGQPLTRYCDQHRMGLEERLALFQKVLSAVHYAHQKAVIHRDLKPSNVLVTEIDGAPVPKVIDFGIARVDADATGLTTAHTAVGTVLGTLEYMSPEQALAPAAGVGTPSDIYSLGVLLYELVTGLLPFPGRTLRTAMPTELERLLRDTEPPPPSRTVGAETDGDAARRALARGTDVRRLSRALRGDLDNIVGMAMRKDAALRYSSVAQFSEDIQRLLEGRPVIARPATWSYRAGRFIGRHRLGVMGSAAAVLAVTGMAAAFTYHLAVERDRAVTEAEKALQVTDFLQEIFRVSDPLSGNEGDVSARQLLDQAAERIATELGDQPEVRASLLGVMGMTYFGLGARDVAVRRLEEAVAVERSLHRGAHPDVATRLHELGTVHGEAGNVGPSEDALREALALRRDLLGERDAATAATMARLATTLRVRGEYGEAEQLAREALGIQRHALGSSHPDIATSLHTLAFILRSQGRLRESEAHYREALEMRRALLHPAHDDVVQTTGNLALVLEGLGEYDEAEILLQEVVERRRDRLGAEHPRSLISLNNLAYMLWRTGQLPRAEAVFAEGIPVARRSFGGDHLTLAIMLNNLGVARRRGGATEEAEVLHREALAMNRRLLGDEHPRIAGDLDNLGRVLLARGDAAGAEALHREALAMRTRLLGADHPDLAESLSGLGEARFARGDSDEAEALLRRALELRTARLGEGNPRTAATAHDLGRVLGVADEHEEAETLLRHALAVRTSTLDGQHPDRAATLRELGILLTRLGRYEEAEPLLTEGLRLAEIRLGNDRPETRQANDALAALHHAREGRATAQGHE